MEDPERFRRRIRLPKDNKSITAYIFVVMRICEIAILIASIALLGMLVVQVDSFHSMGKFSDTGKLWLSVVAVSLS